MKQKKSTDNKIFYNVLYGVIATFILLIFLIFIGNKSKNADYSFDLDSIYDWSEGWSISVGQHVGEVSLPVDIGTEYGNTIIIKKELPNKIKKYNCLMFESTHQDVIVNVGGVLRTSYSDGETRKFGNLSPRAIVMVPIYSTDEGADITIIFTSGNSFSGSIDRIYLGNEKSIILKLIKENIIWLALCVVALIISVACLVCFFVYKNDVEEGSTFIYLCIIGFLASIWVFSQLKIRQMFIGDIHYFDNIGYLCFMIMPIFVAAFSNWIVKGKNYYISIICYSIVLINFVIQSILQFNGIFDFYELIMITRVIFTAIVVCSIIIRYCNIKKKIIVPSIYMHMGLLGLLVGIIADANIGLIIFDYNSGSIFIVGTIIYLGCNIVYIFMRITKEQQRRRDAENANAAKSQFLATMSHEIRTPINAVLGMNEMILRESNEDVIKDYSNNIADAGKSLLSLVNDILDFSKIESGKMDIVCVEYQMKTLLCDLILMIKGRMVQKDLKLILNIDESIPSVYFGDEVRIKQVLTNILTNSAKYTPSGSITLTVENRGIKDDEIELFFSVRDTGIGIKAEDIEKLLNSSFIRVDQARNRNIEGTGLGISITRQLLTLMGSKLVIDSEYGKGSDFNFVLKQKIIDTKAMGSVMSKGERLKKKKEVSFTAPAARILAVDDTKTNLLVIKGLMKPYKCQIFTCESGQECIELCMKEQYDLIFMDHMMPGMDGIETLKKLKAGKGIISSDTKVIALTANAISGAADIYRESGFDGYVTKPIDVNELDECLRNHLPKELIEVNSAESN